ncbi:hypothetical protein ElyMa_006345400 [Elysia marginata]|uniref:Uncharacterized protein n=1 Tax=Elysia marginata TaxID=1093978 RepID=A0AAV4HK70_9GAST|nr:hypothetical protein ElyMa_006345400 [Elysia marginata]
MPGTMNHNSVNNSGIITGNHTRDTTGSRHLTGTRRPLSQQQQQQQQQQQRQKPPQQQQQQQHQCPRLGREKAVIPSGLSKHSTPTHDRGVGSRSQPQPSSSQQISPKSAVPSSLGSTSKSLTTSTLSSSPSSSSTPSIPKPLLLTPLAPISCPSVSSGILSTTQLFPNNSALLAACGVPRPTSPQLSPNSKLAHVFSSYPSLKPSSKSFSFPSSSEEVPDDVIPETQSQNEPSSLNSYLHEANGSYASETHATSGSALSPSSMQLSTQTPDFASGNSVSDTKSRNNNNYNNNNNNNNNNNIIDDAPPHSGVSCLPSVQGLSPHSQVEGSQGMLAPGQSNSQLEEPGNPSDAPQQCDISRSTGGSSSSELQVPREKVRNSFL